MPLKGGRLSILWRYSAMRMRSWIRKLFSERCAMRSSSSTRRCRPPYRHLLLERLESRVVPGFLAPLAFDAGSFPHSVAMGDFNGDGHLDLAVANYGDPYS